MKTLIFKKTFILILLTAFFIPAISFSAELSVSAPDSIRLGDSFEATINLDSDGVLVNSANLVLDYDENKLSFSGYKSENSVIGIWVEAPNEKEGKIYMSGIIPGGVSGLYDPRKSDGGKLGATPLVSLLFTARREGSVNFSFLNTEVLKHDGYGTKLFHTQSNKELAIKNRDVGDDALAQENILTDTEKPSPFEIVFIESSPMSETPSMIIFKAEDSQSGIKGYKMNTGGSRWTEVKSPLPISKGIFSKTITIRAYDFADNFEDSSILIEGLLSGPILTVVIVLMLLFCIICYKMIKYKRNEA